jgi:hypothetical protein
VKSGFTGCARFVNKEVKKKLKYSVTVSNQPILARVSLLLSSVCLVHCLTMPFLILLLPAMASLFSETVEMVLVFMIFPISLIAFLPVWFRHKNSKLLRIFILSLMLIFVSQFIFHLDHFIFTSDTEIAVGAFPMSLMRGVTLIAGTSGLAWSLYRVNKHTHVCTNPGHAH